MISIAQAPCCFGINNFTIITPLHFYSYYKAGRNTIK
jgi:hypothetical protein